ncbi:MAG: aldehyde dehydrogenase family protein [Cyclobacteriaceae bacterium]|nr:aldehyde dehydrogenase family protein [Cyclobacteriaceae bacterium]
MIPNLEEKIVSDWINDLFARQQQYLPTLRTEPVSNRKARLKKLKQWVLLHRPAIQRAIYADFKKPSAEVDGTEIFPVVDEIAHALTNLNRWTTPRKVDAPITMLGTRSYVLAEPKGACLIIAPWNYPFNLCVGPLVSALAAGNSVIIKPSEITSNTSALIKKMCDDLFEDRVVAVCEGGVEVSQCLLKLPFNHIFFTGSPTIGKVVMKAAAENLASVTLELGGKSPTIVTPSANLKDAAKRIAVAKFINNGQTCIAPDYVLIHESVKEKLIERLKEEIKTLFLEGDQPLEQSAHYARIVNEKHVERLSNMLEELVEKGAQLHVGGTVNIADRFIHPVIVSDVPAEAQAMKEEIFGPILPVLTYSKPEEVIREINSRPKPLALYIFGSNRKERDRILKETSAGSVCINDCAVQFLHHNIPFGGVNNSGIGKSHGYAGFLAFSNEKPVLHQRSGLTSISPLYPPYTKRVNMIMDWLLKFI